MRVQQICEPKSTPCPCAIKPAYFLLAARDDVSVSQFIIASAASEKMASVLTRDDRKSEAKKDKRNGFTHKLRRVPDGPAPLADDAACAWHGFLWLLRSGGQRHRVNFGFDGSGFFAPGALEVQHGLQIPVTAAVAQLPLAFIGI